LAHGLRAQDARAIVRQSVELDQVNWHRMKDYAWVAQRTERHFDSAGKVKSEHREKWETIVITGQIHRRMLERDGRPIPDDERRKQEKKLDAAVEKLKRETAAERQRRLSRYEKEREKDRAFLREIPDAYDFRLEGSTSIDGHAAWVIAASPHAGYSPRSGDAHAFAKIRGKLWIDQAEYQWVRLEAETTATISFGWFLARMNPGARLEFEQTRVNGEVWLPKREYDRGTGRVGILKKVAMEEELIWTDYRKFRVESKIIAPR
jgi:hypothetical protein